MYDPLRGIVQKLVWDNGKTVSYLVDDAGTFTRRLNYAADRKVAGVAMWQLELDFKVR